MIRLLYNLLFPLGLLLFLPGYFLKMRRRGNYRRNFGQRFGFYGAEVRARLASRRPTWIHAVSVGEVAIALKLAAKLRELDPAFTCALTTTTTTGYAFANAEARDWMEVIYNPLDYWPIVRSAFATIRPARIVLVEAEVWPNLAAMAQARGVPLALVNARLSPRSERRFLRFRAFVAPTFRCLDLVCVQEERDIARWESLGVRREVIREIGSIKYDPAEGQSDDNLPREVLGKFGVHAGRPILFGGSTHAGEEEILGGTFLGLRAEFPDLLLVVAARHVERTGEIRIALERAGLRVALRSQVGEWGGAEPPDCLLLDTTGELRRWYAVATVVFVGKSLTSRGGQNPVEPILAGKPVLFGPQMENFASLAEALRREHGAIEVRDAEALAARVAELLRMPEMRDRMVANAERVIAHHRGATRRTAELLLLMRAPRQPAWRTAAKSLARAGALLILPPLS
ncbi:MAG: glycosyltransferase N-terminal domain-containing protein [Chthoniobacterales bacterium]